MKNKTAKHGRQLSELEKQFVQEAEDGGFLLAYNDDGTPFAMGATDTDNLFSMQVVQTPEPDGGAFYMLPENPRP